ncbi:hypothetical protein BX600DRAFT_437622 [Xylariales sp. PMI_506]|nr:hypothetical protein BX600DRAFT_437622 [Xylariales sp. PMI_506]
MTTSIPLNQAPKFVAPLPQPTLGAGGSSTVTFSSTIAASPATCLEILLDSVSYATWNKWIPRVVVHEEAPTAAAAAASEPGKEIPRSLAHLASKKGQLLPGAQFCFEVRMNPDSASVTKTELVTTVLEEFERDGRKGLRVAWKTRGDAWYLRAERTQEFLEIDGGQGGCEYYNYETFFGPLTWAVKTFAGGQLEKGLALWIDGLKAAAEKKANLAK